MYAGSGVIEAPDPTITPQLAGRRTMYAEPGGVLVVVWWLTVMAMLKGGEVEVALRSYDSILNVTPRQAVTDQKRKRFNLYLVTVL